MGFESFAGGGFGVIAVLFSLVWVAMLVLGIVLMIAGIRWLLRQGDGTRTGGKSAARPDDPVEVLRQRYARGEIDDEEFERRRRMLGG